MKYNVYCVRDKLNGFMAPILEANEASAKRSFTKAVNEVDGSMFGFAPADFDLYQIGTFDDKSGSVDPINPIQFVVNGASLCFSKKEVNEIEK